MKLVITSDWHSDAITDGARRELDVHNAVTRAAEYAIDHDVDGFLFAGDLTDPDNVRSHRAVARAIVIAGRLENHGIQSAWIPGNHDVIEDGSGDHTLVAIEAAGFTVWDTPARYTFKGIDVIALPFAPHALGYDPDAIVRQIHAADPDPVQLVLGHLSLDGMHPGSETKDMPRGRDVMWPLDALNECFPDALLVGGHYHRACVHNGVHIVGAPVRFTHGEESNSPGFMVVEVG